MADRLPGKTRVPAPAPRPYPLTLLSVLEELGLVHDAPEGSHLQNGVFWESDYAASVAGNDDVEYEEGSFESEDKTIQHGIAYTDGFAFELSRYIQLGFGSGGTMEEQEARAIRRFEAWESEDVARHVREYFMTQVPGGAIPSLEYSPTDAVAVLMTVLAAQAVPPGGGEVYSGAPLILSDRGPSVKLLKDSVVEAAGGVYAPDSGFTVQPTSPEEGGTSVIFATGTISIWRTPIQAFPVASPKVNEGDVLVERSYYVVVDGPIYGIRSRYATDLSA